MVVWTNNNEVRGEFVVLVAGNDDVLESSDEDPLAELSAVDAVKELVAVF